MKFIKYLFGLIVVVILAFAGYLAFVYYVPYSEGDRSGQLIKFSKKGFPIKTWEGQLSQGIGEDRTFYFSVYRKDKPTIEKLKSFNGKNVTLSYEEHFSKFFWWGKTEYFITDVKLDHSPAIPIPTQ